MIRQIVVELNDGKPDLVGLLLVSGDLLEQKMATLGERLARLEGDIAGSLRGVVHGVRWRYVRTDHETPGLEYLTIRVPRGTAAQSYARGTSPIQKALSALEMYPNRPDAETVRSAAVDHRVRRNQPTSERHPCDRSPRWLWVVAALIGLALVVTTCRAEHFVGVI